MRFAARSSSQTATATLLIEDLFAHLILTQGFLGHSQGYGREEMASYRKRNEKKEEWKGHNHPFNEKCGPHCPRNEKYKGPEKKPGFLFRRKR